jgi:hypothetical protein
VRRHANLHDESWDYFLSPFGLWALVAKTCLSLVRIAHCTGLFSQARIIAFFAGDRSRVTGMYEASVVGRPKTC